MHDTSPVIIVVLDNHNIFKMMVFQQSQPINITRCSNQSVIERVPGVQKCISEVYIGQSCMQELAMSQMCTLGIKAQVMLNGIGLLQQQQNEQNIVTLLRVLCELTKNILPIIATMHSNLEN